jgi:hypothetical protein
MVRSLAWNFDYFLVFSQSFQETASVILKLFHGHFLLHDEGFIIRFHTVI